LVRAACCFTTASGNFAESGSARAIAVGKIIVGLLTERQEDYLHG